MKGKKSEALLAYINATVSSTSEEGLDPLLKLMNPSSDRLEMGDVYDDVLGYNPITYFDKEEIRSLTKLCEKYAPEPTAALIKDMEEEIINQTFIRFNTNRSAQLNKDFAAVIKNLTGWSPEAVISQSSETIISNDAYGYSSDNGFEDIQDDESFDEDDESEDYDEDDDYSDEYGDDD